MEETKQCRTCEQFLPLEDFREFRSSGRGKKESDGRGKRYRQGECKYCDARSHARQMAKARYRKFFIEAQKEAVYLAVAEMCRTNPTLLADIIRRDPERYKRYRLIAARKYLEPIFKSAMSRGGHRIKYFGSREEIWKELAEEFGL